MHQFRLTTRRMMAAVGLLAVGLGLSVPAVRVAADRDGHLHCWSADPGENSSSAAVHSPFWPRYWRHLLGRPWRHAAVCGAEQERRGEFCEYAHPDKIVRFASGEVSMVAPEANEPAREQRNGKPNR